MPMSLRRPADVAAGERQAFDEWARPHVPSVRRVAVAYVGLVAADDVVQDVLLRAWLHRDSFDAERGTPRCWLLAITRDRVRGHWRARPRVTLVDLDDYDEPAPDIEPAESGADRRVDLCRAIRALPRRQREALIYFYYADLSVEETAIMMKCSPGTVKSTLADGRRRSAGMLEVT
jgi:RNA polymerase sigma factor (sigma-70 family)